MSHVLSCGHPVACAAFAQSGPEACSWCVEVGVLHERIARAEAEAAVAREALHAHWAYEDHTASCALCISRREQQECTDALTLALSKHESRRKVVLAGDAGKALLAEVEALRKLAEYAQHGVTCVLRVLGHGELGAACDCGLDTAKRDAGGAGGGAR